MANISEPEDLRTELKIDLNDNDSEEDTLEMSVLTSLNVIARCPKGKKLIEDMTDDIVFDLFNSYSKVKFIY